MSNKDPVPGYVVEVRSALGADLCSKASGGVAGICGKEEIRCRGLCAMEIQQRTHALKNLLLEVNLIAPCLIYSLNHEAKWSGSIAIE